MLLSTTEEQRVAPGSVLTTNNGLLTVVSSRPHQDRFVVTFEGIDTREKADLLRGLELSAAPIEDDDALWVHKLIGSQVRDSGDIDRGTVCAVHVNPASDLLELEDGSLVPLRFVSEILDDVIVVEVPSGLFDIQ